ncbi:hypothetical protein D3C87_1783410 [compost metagenome]
MLETAVGVVGPNAGRIFHGLAQIVDAALPDGFRRYCGSRDRHIAKGNIDFVNA